MFQRARLPLFNCLTKNSFPRHSFKSRAFSTSNSFFPESGTKKAQEPLVDSKAVGGNTSYFQIGVNVLLFCGGLYLVSNFIFNSQYKNTGAYKMSMRLLEKSYDITSRIGLPIKAYYSINGRRYGGHYLYLEWKVKGPGGDATVVCRNSFVGGKGTIVGLTATFADGETITLISEDDAPLPTDS